MYTLISVLIIVVCVLLILIVLIQNSKGGGLSSNFASSSQIMGVKKTADIVEKGTWGLAIALLALSLMSVFVIPKNKGVEAKQSAIKGIETSRPAVPVQQQQQAPQQQAPQGK